jgi:hypothetical protein
MRTVVALVALSLLTMALPLSAQERSGPLISDLTVHPSSGPPGTVYTISIRIVSPRDPKEIVSVLHQIREARESDDIPIHDDGAEGDAVNGDGIYSGRSTVPSTAAHRTHHFEVFILDTSGRKSNVLEYHFTVLHGEVTTHIGGPILSGSLTVM